MLSFCHRMGRAGFLVVLAVWIVSLDGCARPSGSISGTVTYKGKRLPYGRVTFVCADGTVVSGKIESDGTYAVPEAPIGPAKVAVRCLEEAMPAVMRVDPSELPSAKQAGPSVNAPQGPMMFQSAEKGSSRPKGFHIPDHYQQAEKSGLSYEVQKGQQTHDIRLY